MNTEDTRSNSTYKSYAPRAKPAHVKFGTEVRRRREAQGMTLEVFAQRAGLTPNYIGTVETGKRDPSLSTIHSLAKGLGVTVGELLGMPAKLSPEAVDAGRLFDRTEAEIQEALLQVLRGIVKKPRG